MAGPLRELASLPPCTPDTQLAQGRSAEAKALYQSVERHPAARIAKKARHMLFGFKVRKQPWVAGPDAAP